MQAIVKKWGNSAALRIPAAALKEAKLKLNQRVEISLEGEKLIITALKADDLEAMVAQITDQNKHTPVDFGKPLGRELLS